MKAYHLFLDQYGQPIWARTVEELRAEVGGGRASKMYTDKKDGSTVHVGYVIGRRPRKCSRKGLTSATRS